MSCPGLVDWGVESSYHSCLPKDSLKDCLTTSTYPNKQTHASYFAFLFPRWEATLSAALHKLVTHRLSVPKRIASRTLTGF
jgi:hypothetical protein